MEGDVFAVLGRKASNCVRAGVTERFRPIAKPPAAFMAEMLQQGLKRRVGFERFAFGPAKGVERRIAAASAKVRPERIEEGPLQPPNGGMVDERALA